MKLEDKQYMYLLLDASKAFDRVCYNELFKILLDKKVCPRIVSIAMLYVSQSGLLCESNSKNSTDFSVSNGVKQGAVISPILFTAYMDKIFKELERNGTGCHVGPVYAGAFGYADDVALVAPSLYSLKCMIATCEEFAKKHQITFNTTKLKLLCFNASNAVTPHIKLNGQPVSVVHKDKHLGNYISGSIHDHHILNNVCDLYQRSNLINSQFRSCDSETLDRLHKTYCMHMYGCELWNLSCNYIKDYR